MEQAIESAVLEEAFRDMVEQLEHSAERRRELQRWILDYQDGLLQLSALEERSGHYLWTLGDLMHELENRYGEAAHTIIEQIHSYLDDRLGLHISLNKLYRAEKFAKIFPPEYRFREIPYSVYQIIGEMGVHAPHDIIEATRRRRELVLSLYQAKKNPETFIPTDYHAIRAFCESVLRERYGAPIETARKATRNAIDAVPVASLGSSSPSSGALPVLAPSSVFEREEVIDVQAQVISDEVIYPNEVRIRTTHYWSHDARCWFELTFTRDGNLSDTVLDRVQSALQNLMEELVRDGYSIQKFDT